MKESGGDITKITSLIQETAGQQFQMLAGSASFLLPALTVGAVGGICALANALPAEVCALQQLWKQGRAEEARQLQLRLVAPNAAVRCTLCSILNRQNKISVDIGVSIWRSIIINIVARLTSETIVIMQVTKQFGVAGLKVAMEWFGYYGGPTRRPLLPLTATETETLRATFTGNQFLAD